MATSVVGGVPRGLVGVPEGYFVECATLSGDRELHAGVGGGRAGLVPNHMRLCADDDLSNLENLASFCQKGLLSEYYPMLNAPHLKLE
jgi:hypothetical protein